jgi:hypothetical protein
MFHYCIALYQTPQKGLLRDARLVAAREKREQQQEVREKATQDKIAAKKQVLTAIKAGFEARHLPL